MSLLSFAKGLFRAISPQKTSIDLQSKIKTLLGIACLGCVILAGTGCGSKKDPFQGPRQRFLVEHPSLEVETKDDNINIELDSPITNSSWTHSSDNASHLIPHAEFEHHHATVWKESIGSGSSSSAYLLSQPVTDDELIFTLDSQGLVMARQLSSGKKMWSKQLPLKGETDNCLGGGLAVHQGKIYASFSSADVFCLDALNGAILWQTAVIHPIRSAPTVKNNLVYVITKQNSVIALNALTGEKVWHHEGASEMCSLLGGGTVAADRHTVIIPYATGELFALKAENGFPLWAESLGSAPTVSSVSMVSQIKTDPVIDKGLVIVSSQSGRMAGLEFRTGTRIWEKDISCLSTPVLSGSFIFAVSTKGEAICLMKETGKIVWIKPLKAKEDGDKDLHWLGPLLAGDQLYIVNSSGKVLSLNPKNGDTINTFSVPGPIYITPIIANKIMYFLNDAGKLIAVD